MHAQNIYKRRYEHKCFVCNQKSVTFKVFLTFSDDENFTKKWRQPFTDFITKMADNGNETRTFTCGRFSVFSG